LSRLGGGFLFWDEEESGADGVGGALATAFEKVRQNDASGASTAGHV